MKPEIKCMVTKSAAFAAALSVANVLATDYTWVGVTGGGDGVTWTDTANWDGGDKFVSSTSNRLIFQNPTANAVISLPSDLSVNSIKFASGCKAMTLTGTTGRKITNTYKSETLTDSTTETGASIFVETTEPIKIDVIQVMTGGRSVGLAQGAHLEILKPIVDNSQKKGRVYFRTLGGSKNSYLKIDYDPTTADYSLDPVEGNFLFKFIGGTNELGGAVCVTAQANPKPIAGESLGMLKLNAGNYPREFSIGGVGCVLKTDGTVALGTNVLVYSRQSTLDFGGATTISGKLHYLYTDNEVIAHTLNFGGNTSIGGDFTIAKYAGTYLFDLASNVRVDFNGQVNVSGATLNQHIPTTSAIHYHGLVRSGNFCDDATEPSSGHRGGEIHLYAGLNPSIFYLRGYNVVCEAANVLPSGNDVRWRYEGQTNCGIVDMNGFDQTVKHLNAIGSFNGLDKNIIKSDKPCTLTINDTYGDAQSANARIAVQGAITIVHGGTETQEFNSRDINTTGDITINSGKIKLSGTTAIYNVKKITIGADGELVLAGTSATPIPVDAVLYLDSAGGGIDATDYQGTALTLSNRVCIDGLLVTNGTYTAANASWLKGGKITVNADYSSAWRQAVNGNWSESDKWSKQPGAGEAAFVDASGADYTVSLTVDNAAMGPLTIGNAGVGTATLAVGANVSWPAWSTVKVGDGGRLLVGSGGVLAYNSYEHNGDNFLLEQGGRLELANDAQVTLATKKTDYSPFSQMGGDVVVGGTSKLTLEGGQLLYFGSGKTILKDSAVLETVTGKDKNGSSLSNVRLYTRSTVLGVTNHIVVQDHASFHPKDDNRSNLDQVIFGYPYGAAAYLFRMDYNSDAYSFFGNQIELGGTWGYAEMNVTAGTVALGNYGIGVGGFHYSGRGTENANVVGVLNVSGGLVDVNAQSYGDTKNRVRGLLLGEGWYNKKTATSDNLFTGYVNLSGGAISNRHGAVILGAGTAKGVWTQTGGEFANTSAQTKGPMILGWLGGEGTYILSNGTVKVTSANVTTYVGGAETNLTPWVLEAQAPSSADAATGLLSLQGGTFTTAGDIVVGQDGNGTIEVGVNGALAARTLELKVAAAGEGKPAHSSALKFKAGATTCGRITLSGAMKSRNDATLEFDLSDWNGSSRLRFLECSGLEGGAVAWGNVAFVGVEKSDFHNAGGTRYVYRQNAKGIVIGKMTGFMVNFR